MLCGISYYQFPIKSGDHGGALGASHKAFGVKVAALTDDISLVCPLDVFRRVFRYIIGVGGYKESSKKFEPGSKCRAAI